MWLQQLQLARAGGAVVVQQQTVDQRLGRAATVRGLAQQGVETLQYVPGLAQVGASGIADGAYRLRRRSRGERRACGAQSLQGLIPTLCGRDLVRGGRGARQAERIDLRIAAVPAWADAANPLVQRRMGGQEPPP